MRSLQRLEHIVQLAAYVRKHYPVTPPFGVYHAARILMTVGYPVPGGSQEPPTRMEGFVELATEVRSVTNKGPSESV